MNKDTIHISKELLEIFKHSHSLQNLIPQVADYYCRRFPHVPFLVVEPDSSINSYKVIFTHGEDKNILERFDGIIGKIQHLQELRVYSIFMILNHMNKPDYLFYFSSLVDRQYSEINADFEWLNCFYHGFSAHVHQKNTYEQNRFANLVSHVSHDINSLINLMDKNGIPDPLAGKMQYMENLIPQLLLYIREVELVRVTLNVDDLLSGIVESHPYSDRIQIEGFEGNFMISCDVELINRAIAEIIDNAIQATDKSAGKIRITVNIQKSLPILGRNHFLQLQIMDSGPGIPDEYISLVFNPFFTTKKSDGRAGLGLSIARKIIEAHEGRIYIKPKRNDSFSVSILLPLKLETYEKE